MDPDATVKLIMGAVREMSTDPKVGRAEALRRSTLALIGVTAGPHGGKQGRGGGRGRR